MINYISLACFLVFFFEFVFKVFAWGVDEYFYKFWNIFDFFMLLILTFDILIVYQDRDVQTDSYVNLSFFRILRIVRFVRLIRVSKVVFLLTIDVS